MKPIEKVLAAVMGAFSVLHMAELAIDELFLQSCIRLQAEISAFRLVSRIKTTA